MPGLKASWRSSRRNSQEIYDLRQAAARLEAAKTHEFGRLQGQLRRVLYWLEQPDQALVALLESITEQRNALYCTVLETQSQLDQCREQQSQLRAELREAQATIASLLEENERLRQDSEVPHGETVSS